MFHPGVARIKCSDCRKRLHNMETGEPQTYTSGPNKELKFFDGPAHENKSPCMTGGKCPKIHYSREAEFVLSTKNHNTVLLWRHVRSTHGRILEGGHVDRLLADNLAILDDIYQQRERWRNNKDSTDGLLNLIPFLRR